MLKVLLIPLALLGMLVGAVYWSGGAEEKRADFAFINRGDIHTLDLNVMSYMQDFRLTYAIREGLYNLDGQTYEPVAAVAAGHELSADRRVYTFRLRPEAKWHNGDPVTAHDFAFSWRRMMAEPGEYSSLFHYVQGAQDFEKAYARGEPLEWKTVGAEVVDDRTFRVTLKNPVRFFLDLIAFPPYYPRHERSMAPFRSFADEDVIGPFEAYVAAAKQGGAGVDAARLASDAGMAGATLEAGAVAAFVKAAQGFETAKATEGELLDMLGLFAAMRPLNGVKASGGAVEGDALSGLAPAAKLERMLATRFVRYVFDKKYTRPPHVVCNGPFVLTRWDFKRRLWMGRNPTYWDRANVRSASIEMIASEVPQSQLLMYETGVVDWNSDVPSEQAANMRGRGDLRTADAYGTNFITLQCKAALPASLGGGKNPLADVRVRQALAMALDKRYFVETITRMGELPARTYMPPDGTLKEFTWRPGPYDAGRTEPYTYGDLQKSLRTKEGLTGPGPGLPYDPKRARELLAEAGYPGGKGFGSFPILYNTGNPTRRQIAQVLKEQWKRELGIDLPITGVEGKIFQQQVTSKDYFVATVAWYGDYPDISTFTDKYKSTSLNNDSGWERPPYDELVDRAEREPDDAKRAALLSEAAAMIDAEVPIIPIYHYVNVSMSRDNVHGVRPNARNITIFKDMWVDRKKK